MTTVESSHSRERSKLRGMTSRSISVMRLTGMAEQFCTTLDCVDVGFIPDRLLDDLPLGPRSVQPGSAAST